MTPDFVHTPGLLILFSLCALAVPPTIAGSSSVQDISTTVTQEISLECRVEGVPFPIIQWYKDRK